jgi:putative molybdopterin biosynthesis protein
MPQSLYAGLERPEVPLDEARERWISELQFLRALRRAEFEEIPAGEAAGRVTSQSVTAQISSPHYYAAAIDGLALRSRDTVEATPSSPCALHLGRDGTFVDTGSALPEGFDAVVPIHEIRLASTEVVEVNRPSTPWRNVRPAGEDLADREVILPRDYRIGPLEVGAMLAGGVLTVQVYRRPRVAILAVGSSLVPASVPPGVGEMIDSNSPILTGLVHWAGGEPCPLGVVAERIEEVEAALHRAARHHDMVLVVAGPSHRTPLLATLFERLGELVVHGVAIKPGHSVALGAIERKPVLGLPFYPVSAFLTFELFARPVIEAMLGQRPREPVVDEAILADGLCSPAGVEEFLRVKMGIVDGRRVAVPISRGAALLMSLVRADGMVHVPAKVCSLEVGASVAVRRLDPVRRIDGNILLLGTHDACYDLLRTHLLHVNPDLHLFSANTGSEAGIERLRQGLCHLAAAHIFDPQSGEYNIPYLREKAADLPVVLVNLFRRFLGLVVAQGNPKGIASLQDLARPEVRMVNRQAGSGTRRLLDHHLARHGLEPSSLNGYDRETHTHMSAAAIVSSGAADVGLAIPAAAKALRLDFVPCLPERLDLAIPKKLFNAYSMQALLGVIRSRDFQECAGRLLEGYDFSQAGTVLWETP